ncbi:uncharacterized protein LOC129909423 [Episyrphus balteatus]|uniref:uncharacterized protein LOC129909423 n=1 Tax=Episyrphus balteatus TaxID=286459 RepID=UPI0024854991|nr:uncharacterized protein LOC129909423 [Episyrphus balteatus]
MLVTRSPENKGAGGQQNEPAIQQAQPQPQRRRATCKVCEEPYNEEMILCEGVCRKWFHFICVGISSVQADELDRWVCDDCKEGYRKRVEILCREVIALNEVAQKTIDLKKRGTVIRSAIEKFNNAKQKYITLTGSFIDQNGDPLPTPRLEQAREMVTEEDNESEGRSTSSKNTSMSTATRVKMRLLERQRKVLKEQRLNLQLEHDVLKQQQDLIDQASVCDLDSEDEENDQDNNIKLNPQARELNPIKIHNQFNLSTYEPTISGEYKPPFDQRQIAARKIYRALPTFTGELEEWPVFKRMFEQSTKECGYSNEENLMRLQQSLKGRARNEVASQLCEPSCIPDIMESLMLAFGQKTVILNAQIDRMSKFSPVRADKLESIIQFSTAVTNMNAIMKASSLESQYDNPLLLKELLKKLNNDMKMKWASYAYENNVSGVLAFGSWLKIEAKKVYSILPSFERVEKQPSKKETRINVHVINDSFLKCIVCSNKCKSVESCAVFKGLPSSDRWEKVKELKLCRQCLIVHRMKYPFNCKKAVKCNVAGCSRKHHPLMHLEVNSQINLPVVESIQNSHTRLGDDFQFQYLPVILHHGNKKQQVMAFLDGGSSGTRIEEDVAEQLGLTGPKVILNLKWTANVTRQEESTKVSVSISGVYEGAKKYVIPEAHTIRELNLPKQTLSYEELANKYNHLRGLPVCSYKSTQPKIMIGISDWHLAVPIKARLAGDKDPVATKCKLGWSVFGSKRISDYESVNYHVEEHREPDDEDLHESMKKYFSIETLGVRVPKDDLSSKEDRRATSVMQKTTKLVGQKYETGLLWRCDDVDLPDSYPMAKFRLKTLNRRFEKNQQLKLEIPT